MSHAQDRTTAPPHITKPETPSPRLSISIAALGFIRRMVIAFGLMVLIPLLVMVYVHLRGTEISFPMVLISTALASTVGFYVVWEMVNRVLILVQDAKRYAAHDSRQQDDHGMLEQSFSRLIQQMQVNMSELETKARLLEETEQRLGDANVYSAQIIAAIADFVIVMDPRMRVTKVNGAMQTGLGYQMEDLKDRPIETVLRGTGGGEKLLAQHELTELTKQGTLWGKSGMLRSRGGEGIPVQMNLSLVTHSNGKLDGIVIVARDVRETLRLVADLQRANATLEERVRQRTVDIEHALREREKANLELTRKDDQLIRQEKMASLGQLAAGVAHEISTPVGFVSGTLQMLQTRLDELAEYVERSASLVVRLSDSGLSDAAEKQIRDFAREKARPQTAQAIEAAKQSVVESIDRLNRVKKIVTALQEFSHADQDKPAWADLNEGVESTINIVGNELKHKATLHRDYGDLPKMLCYPRQLNQVLMNLLVNAAQAIPDRGEIWVKTWADTRNVYVDIRDSGTGIPEDYLSKIFDPFFTTKPVGQGTGLGLSIVSGIVERHGGSVRVDSRVGEGTTFHLSFPIQRVGQAA